MPLSPNDVSYHHHSPISPEHPEHQTTYDHWLLTINARYRLLGADRPLFTTDSPKLWELFLECFPPQYRQHYHCTACRHFLRRYGGLVLVSPSGGSLTPVLWQGEHQSTVFDTVSARLHQYVAHRPITGLFVSEHTVWGEPRTNGWTHLSIHDVLPTHQFHQTRLHTSKNAGQWLAEKREDFNTVQVALAEYRLDVLQKALALLDLNLLPNSNAVKPQARWLADLKTRTATLTRPDHIFQLIWLAVAEAPAGFCHPRTSMLGTLLDDLRTGNMTIETVKARFAKKMTPSQYQRPQAPPKEGNIARAEQVFEALQLGPALKRRPATVAELREQGRFLWHYVSQDQRQAQTPGAPLFGHLRTPPPSAHPEAITQEQRYTWAKFRTELLPVARSISVFLPQGKLPLGTLVTATDPTAKPIVQWDEPEHRNPVSWYVHIGGSTPESWRLQSNFWHPVTAICLLPNLWQGEDRFTHINTGACFLIDGACDTTTTGGVALFPVFLRSELHEITSTIEAYAKTAHFDPVEGPHASGLFVYKEHPTWNVRLRAETDQVRLRVLLDRWE